MTPVIKPRPCKCCKSLFTPRSSLARACGQPCAQQLVEADKARKAKLLESANRKETRAKLEKLKSRGAWLKEAKTAIQQARRLEELAKGSGCMSCGRSQREVVGTDGWKPGGAWDGGHFLSKGARPELALEPLNIWLQCKSCNAGSGKYARKGHTVNAAFRVNLIARIGLDAVERLEADHAQRHYSVEDLKHIKKTNQAKARELQKAHA